MWIKPDCVLQVNVLCALAECNSSTIDSMENLDYFDTKCSGRGRYWLKPIQNDSKTLRKEQKPAAIASSDMKTALNQRKSSVKPERQNILYNYIRTARKSRIPHQIRKIFTYKARINQSQNIG